MQAGGVPLGAEILIGINNNNFISPSGEHKVPVIVIGRYVAGEVCVGFNDDSQINPRCANKVSDHIYEKWDGDSNYIVIPIAKTFKYYYWLSPLTEVWLAAEQIVKTDQICVGCNMPAPHGKANMPDNKFQCLSCKVLEELG